MPVLPLDHPEPFAAVLGTMLYPGFDDCERRKARAFAAQYLAEPLRQFFEAGGDLPVEQLRRMITDAGEPLADLEQRWRDGLAMGDIFKTLFSCMMNDPEQASWNQAISAVEVAYSRNKEPGSRSSFWAAKRRCLSAAHLWAAWSLREGKFVQQPDVGYCGYEDLQAFLTEAEIFRDHGQNWRSEEAVFKPFLPPDVWRVPDDWEPLEWQPGWPPTGKIPYYTVDATLFEGLKSRGRPRLIRT